MAASISLGSAFGSLLLSLTLKSTGSYAAFLFISGTLTLCGSTLFLLLPRRAGQIAGADQPIPADPPVL
jgi:dipeptide/tripeptide permease